MGVVNQPEDLLTRIRDLERQVKEMRRGTLSNAAISQGAIEVRTVSGQVLLRVGEIAWGGSTAYGLITYRVDGTASMVVWDNPGGGGYTALLDEQQNVIVSNDTVSGSGLATPYIGSHPVPWSRVLNPPEATTSGSFGALWRIHHRKQHPQVFVRVLVKTAADTSGEVQLTCAGSVISGALGVAVGTNSYFDLVGSVPGSHMSIQNVDVEARRTAGTGSVQVEVAIVQGVQS